MAQYRKYVTFKGKILIVGFGAVGQGTLPLILRHIDVPLQNVKVITAEDWGHEIAREYGVEFVVEPLTRDNYVAVLQRELKAGDFLFNASFDVSSLALIEYCSEHGILYLDACIEPWAGGHRDVSVSAARRSNYAYREAALAMRERYRHGPAVVLMHGANPGLVSHFVKQALLDINRDTGRNLPEPKSKEAWARLAMQLGVKLIQIAERDRQIAGVRKAWGEFANTWSSGAFVGESLQPAELGWGTHERHWPREGMEYGFGCGSSIYLNRPGCTTRVRSWVPKEGPYHGWLISHGESHSIPDYYTVRENGRAIYRPTCYYAYHPCDDAVLSLHEMVGHNFEMQTRTRLLREELVDGFDELGVLLAGHAKNAYWYGSQLSIHQARELCPHNNATSLQVNAAALGAIVWAMQNPRAGIVEPDDLDFRTVLEIAMPYLGRVVGVYSDWTPLEGRGKLFPEDVDRDDPWQFKNFLVM
ncbi:MAG TPA: saccharopine dehydrogenase C-terminal domain-containing protein [Burkholderiales bacterium]|nr:saccharopine dehydrogenase C-terminal domain-containing protein [Burkholderiales bacterium]